MKKYAPIVILILFIIIFIGSFILFSLPGSSLPKYNWLEIPHLDKYIHVSIFFTLCFIGALTINIIKQRKLRLLHSLILCLAFLLYGIGIEFYQESYVEGRAFESVDIVADGIGCLLFLIWFVIGGWLKKVGPDRNRDLNQN